MQIFSSLYFRFIIVSEGIVISDYSLSSYLSLIISQASSIYLAVLSQDMASVYKPMSNVSFLWAFCF